MTATPLLGTELHAPRQRREMVRRPRLRKLLIGRDQPALTLVSAPAGFGKTTLLTEWFAGGPEIARQLLVSLNTMRTHTKNIYAKVGVNNRRAAVRRASELGL